MEFRNDINGLRAIAVVAVVLYHFGMRGITGGFVGVDIFFVLSGFLMTAIILGGLERGSFSLGQFYLSRARRILPALLAVCGALLIFGWWWLAPTEYTTLAKHSSAAATFISNFVFKDEEGYFDAPSQAKWLLHTWSLSVEWQFYLLYPLLLMAFRRFVSRASRRVEALLWFLTAASLIACIIVSRSDSGFAFYLLPTRAWEMLIGGLAWRYGPRLNLSTRQRQCGTVAGLLFIALSILLFTPQLRWPGFYALLPTMGAVLIILAQPPRQWLLSHPVAQALGRWSYSIYLWHWPLVVGLTYFDRKHGVWIAAGIAASVLLGALSYRFIEQPTRRYFTRTHWRAGVIAAIIGVGLILLASGAIQRANGIPSRVSDDVAAIDREAKNHFPMPAGCGFNRKTQTLTPCIIGDEKHPRWVIWGDSHAGTIAGAVQAALPGGIQLYWHQCSPIFDSEVRSKNDDNHCTSFMQQTWQQIETLPRDAAIIIINRYSVQTRGPNEVSNRAWGINYNQLTLEEAAMDADTLYRKRVADSLCRMAEKRRVIAVMPIPEMGFDVPRTMARMAMTGATATPLGIPRATYDARNEVARAALQDAHKRCGVALLDPTPYLCKNGFCAAETEGIPRYLDNNHLSESGNRLLIPMFKQLQ